MNISTGGPHILLFERDQQLVALLNSELQLAGYEIHTARTAVEVFDAIARYPVRLVLVDLAQAAAARREFWVALDTQRRGRSVQVLTFHCTNIAGYGPANDEPDERSQNMLADVEVDGMLGIMNMVNAIRSRIAASTVSNTGTISRLASSPNNPPSIGSQVTIPIPSLHHPPNNQSPTNPIHSPIQGTSPAVPPMSPQAQPPMQSSPPQAVIQPITPSTPVSSPLSQASPTERPRTSNPNQTDKIRAVIYPNQRTWSSGRDTAGGSGQFSSTNREQVQQETPWSAQNAQQISGTIPPTPPTYPTYPNATPAADIYGNGQGGQGGQEMPPINEGTLPKESGLAQLSRMLQEHRAPMGEDIPQEPSATRNPPVTPAHSQQEDTALQQRVRPNEAPPISTLSMRASPIQDLPTDRINVGQNDTSSFRRIDEASHTSTSTSSSSPTLMSIANSAQSSTPPPPPMQATPSSVQAQTQEHTGRPGSVQGTNTPFHSEPETLAEEPPQDYSSHENEVNAQPVQAAQPLNANANTGNALAEEIQAVVRANSSVQELTSKTPDNALLLDIVQSLPAMPAPTRQPQVHQGRATRSLGSVLLEGHLVPQNRLEVALNIQRMLRGVDMNYQLGEILLMFKLLTPDQLLAASLVSYGLITPAQISALGRIRQELHAIGLEYDLENLLILFRILTSEQLREVRLSWSG
jgi:hypothetical protein